jgi:hypothetical protein
MSDNYRRYAQKMAELKAERGAAPHPLRERLEELLLVVKRCENIWAIEDRIEKSLDRHLGFGPSSDDFAGSR